MVPKSFKRKSPQPDKVFIKIDSVGGGKKMPSTKAGQESEENVPWHTVVIGLLRIFLRWRRLFSIAVFNFGYFLP